MLVARETTGCSSQAMWSIALVNYKRLQQHNNVTNACALPYPEQKRPFADAHIRWECPRRKFFSTDIKVSLRKWRWRKTTKADTVFEKLTQKSKRIMWVFKHVLLNKYSHVLDFTPSDIVINMQNFKHTEQLNAFFPFSARLRKYTKRNIPLLSPANENWEGVRKTSQTSVLASPPISAFCRKWCKESELNEFMRCFALSLTVRIIQIETRWAPYVASGLTWN